MPFDEGPEDEGGGDDHFDHEGLAEFAGDTVLPGFLMTCEVNGKCRDCTLPHAIRVMIEELFLSGHRRGLPEMVVMSLVEAMANSARKSAREEILKSDA